MLYLFHVRNKDNNNNNNNNNNNTLPPVFLLNHWSIF